MMTNEASATEVHPELSFRWTLMVVLAALQETAAQEHWLHSQILLVMVFFFFEAQVLDEWIIYLKNKKQTKIQNKWSIWLNRLCPWVINKTSRWIKLLCFCLKNPKWDNKVNSLQLVHPVMWTRAFGFASKWLAQLSICCLYCLPFFL